MTTPTEDEPRSIGRWEVREKLGVGDFGYVYVVIAPDGTEAALKAATAGSIGARRLAIEAQALEELDHPAIPALIDRGEDEGNKYLVMSLGPRPTLADIVARKQEEGGLFGDIATLSILERLLDALHHSHESGWVHRDIKGANVLVSDGLTRVSLIDWGFAKKDGVEEIRLSDSFWRAGAAPFSPPSKLENPAHAVPVHDVFAVGVLGYQLLTGRYPFGGDSRRGVGEVRAAHRRGPARNVRDYVPTVRREVADFVASLLQLDDDLRPSAESARASARQVLAELSPLVPTEIIYVPHLTFPEVTRDPIYGDVRLTVYERRVLDTAEMQRLRRIRQLGLTNLVFMGAEHSRLSHAVGVLHRVEQILRSLADVQGTAIDEQTRLVARLYGLVHDVTHVAIGHTLEDELGFFERHDRNTPRVRRLVLSDQSQLNSVLNESGVGRDVLSMFDPEATIHTRSSIHDLVSGPTGADVLDYIDRDAYYCGLDHRVDSALFRQFRLTQTTTPDEERLVSLLYGSRGVRIDREFAVESILNERYALFLKVYTHPVKVAASALLGKALAAALFPARGHPEFDEKVLEWMGDEVLLHVLSQSKRSQVSDLAKRVLFRRLPVPVYRARLLADGSDRSDAQFEVRQKRFGEMGLFDPEGRRALEQQLAKSANMGADEVLVYCPPKAPGYERVRYLVSRGPGESAVLDEAHSPYLATRMKHLGLWELLGFSLSDEGPKQSRLASALEGYFGFTNDISLDRRKDTLF